MMKLIRYIWENSKIKILNSKMGVFAIIMFLICMTYNRPVRLFAGAVKYPCNWCVMPFLMCYYMFLLCFWFGILYINSDIPFMQYINMYQIIRTGRIKWTIGQIGGIFLRSLIAVLITVSSTIITLAPKIEFSNTWGKLLHTAAMTNAGEIYNFKYPIFYDIFEKYSPGQIMLLCICICILTTTFFGILIFCLCLYTNKFISVAIGGATILLTFFIMDIHPKIRYKFARIIPIMWCEIAQIETTDQGYYWMPSISYMLIFLLVGILVLSLLIMFRVTHIEFYWENEDV